MKKIEEGQMFYRPDFDKNIVEEFKVIKIDENGSTLWYTLNDGAYKIKYNDKTINQLCLSQDEAQKKIDDKVRDLVMSFETEVDMVNYMVKKIKHILTFDETGWAFQGRELKMFKEALKVRFGIDFDKE